jgi:hypothetical protein
VEILFTVDTQIPPAPVVLSPARNVTVGSATPTFTGTSDAGSTVTLYVDSVAVGQIQADSTGNWSYTLADPLIDGLHAVRASATDGAGNAGPLSSSTPFFVDTLEPQRPRVTSLEDGAFLKDSTPSLLGTAEAGSTVTVVVDGSIVLTTQVDASGAWSLEFSTALSEGAHSLTFTATDAVGNSTAEPLTLGFTVDVTAPDTSLVEGSPQLQTYPPTATFEFSSNEEGGTFQCSFDGANFSECTSPLTLEELSAGDHTFRVQAVDKAGNVDAEPVTYSWSRDLAVMEGGGCSASAGATSALLAWLSLAVLAARRRGFGATAHRKGRALLGVALALGGLGLSSTASAQELEALPGFDLERLDINPGRGTLLVGSGELMLPRTFRVSLGTHYQSAPLRMRVGEQKVELVRHRVTGVLVGAVGVLPWLEVGVQVPGVALQSGDDPSSQGLQAPASRGLGPPMAHARMGVLSRRAGHAFDMAVDIGLGLPLGSSEALAREPLVRLQSHVLLGRRLGPLYAALDGGLLLRVPGDLGPETLTRSKLGQELRLGGGLLTRGKGLKAEASVRVALALETGQRSGELLAGVRYPLYSWLELYALGGAGLGSLPGTPGFRMLLGVAAGHPPPPETPVTRRASSWQQPLEPSPRESGRPQPLRVPGDPE